MKAQQKCVDGTNSLKESLVVLDQQKQQNVNAENVSMYCDCNEW